VIAASDVQNQDLPGRGLISTGTSLGVSVFRLRRPQGATDTNFYRDPTAVMDLVLRWDVGGVYVYSDPDRHTSVGVERHVKPRDDASKELLDVWTQIHERGPGFNGTAGHDEEYRHYWVHNVVSAPFPAKPDIDPQATVLYDIYYSTERSSFPMDLEDNGRRLLQSTHILER
jgi:hypothetical protein